MYLHFCLLCLFTHTCNVYIDVYMYVCIYTHTCLITSCMYVCMYVRMHACMHACMYVHKCANPTPYRDVCELREEQNLFWDSTPGSRLSNLHRGSESLHGPQLHARDPGKERAVGFSEAPSPADA